MEKGIYNQILANAKQGKKMLACLIDPDKVHENEIAKLINQTKNTIITHIFVGGSIVENNKTETIVKAIKKNTELPVLLFPGDYTHLTNTADGLLFLSLLSGRNPEYLIEQQVKSIPFLKKSTLEIISTGYLLVDGGKVSSVQKVSNTQPLALQQETIINTALAGAYMGSKLIYLEAGSGANISIPIEIIAAVKKVLRIPLIVGGGIKSITQLQNIFNAGADVVVIGTAFEKDDTLYNSLKQSQLFINE
ncbi:geranylgeranylglyceryl/heptaprenylglyceryl phosphate synthase [Zhouia sp. PK063]|uniref:geranylgeranylglyceryl/heptaprenylglyceryl phosphate synthase n=1 Tax=Zhouia sp. PK063 TaxID=3373602 RepID=UPI0037B25971